MSDGKDMEQPLVFGLDIGTRNVVGTVGYRTEYQLRLSGGERSYRGRHSYTGSAWN